MEQDWSWSSCSHQRLLLLLSTTHPFPEGEGGLGPEMVHWAWSCIQGLTWRKERTNSCRLLSGLHMWAMAWEYPTHVHTPEMSEQQCNKRRVEGEEGSPRDVVAIWPTLHKSGIHQADKRIHSSKDTVGILLFALFSRLSSHLFQVGLKFGISWGWPWASNSPVSPLLDGRHVLPYLVGFWGLNLKLHTCWVERHSTTWAHPLSMDLSF